MGAEAQKFEFECERERIVGTLQLPEASARAVVVTTGPLTSVKEQATGAYARALAQRGFAALAFDHRYFGESGGSPRQFENPAAKIADIRAAVAALRSASATAGLPVCAVGVCAGAGYMARAVAEEELISVFAGVAGYYAETDDAAIERAAPRIERGKAAERVWR